MSLVMERPAMPRRPDSQVPRLVVLLLAVLIGAAAGGLLLRYAAPQFGARPRGPALDPNAEERPTLPKSPLNADEQEAVNVFKGARDSVVNVDTVVRVRRLDMQVLERQTGTGSGFVWDTDGRVVTNFHVIREAVTSGYAVRVVLADKTSWDGRVVGASPDHDLAVVQIAAPKDKLKPIGVGTSADLQVGQTVYAIGNPFAYSLTMTKGIVSAIDRQIESPGERPITGAIQHQAPINPGNSGGPLLDKDGRLVGVNTSIASPSGGNVGIGFAIPIDTVNPIVTELIRRGKILQPDLGIELVNQQRLRRAGFSYGVMIGKIEPDGPAAQAGLRGLRIDQQSGDVFPGDLIVALDGKEVGNNAEFARAIAERKVGDKVKLTVERGDQTFDVEVTLRGV